jgi:hypothetical protein
MGFSRVESLKNIVAYLAAVTDQSQSKSKRVSWGERVENGWRLRLLPASWHCS